MSFRTNRFEHILISRPSSKTISLSTNPIFSLFQYLVAIRALGLHYTRRRNIFGIYLLNLLTKFMVKTNLRIPPKNTLFVDLRSGEAKFRIFYSKKLLSARLRFANAQLQIRFSGGKQLLLDFWEDALPRKSIYSSRSRFPPENLI